MDDKPRTPDTPDFKAFYAEASKQLPKASEYLQSKHIPMETARKMNLGFYDPATMPEAKQILMELTGSDPAEASTVIIPFDDRYWIGLDTKKDAIITPKVPADALKAIMGWGDLYDVERPIWLAPDPLDALALKAIGASAFYAAPLGRKEAREILKKSPPIYSIILISNDERGHIVLEECARDLFRDGIPATAPKSPDSKWKGAWDRLMTDPGSLREYVEAMEAQVIEGRTTERQREEMAASGNSAQSFLDRMRTADPIDAIPTGLKFLDDKLDGGLYPGLYVMGARSSMGKTSLILQMADRMSEDSHDVMFFTIEQSPDELMAKSFSRITWEYAALDGMEGVSPRKILRGAPRWTDHDADILDMAARRYEDMARRLWIIDRDATRESDNRGDGDRIGLDTIRKAIEEHISTTGIRPVVFIDYLQILNSDDVTGTKSDKQRMDETISELRRISKSYGGIPILTISSLNRAAYGGPVKFDAFKESGAIEYSADVILAIQPRDLKSGEDKRDQKHNEDAYARLEDVSARELEIHVIKNRMGRIGTVPVLFDVKRGMYECDPPDAA